MNAINKSFGSFDKFKEQFIQCGIEVFGSGYVFLVMDENDNLKLMTTANGDNPMVLGFHPVLGT